MRCPNCRALVRGEEGVCELCGATLPTAAAPHLPRGARPARAPLTPPNDGSGGRRPSTLGELFGGGAPSNARPRQGPSTDSTSLPRYGLQSAPPTPPLNARWGAPPPQPPEPDPPPVRPRYRRDTAGVVGSLRAALEILPDPRTVGRGGKRQRDDGAARKPGWRLGRGHGQQAHPPSPPPDVDDPWAQDPAPDGSWGRQGSNMPGPAQGWGAPAAAPPPEYGGWDAHAAPPGYDAWQAAPAPQASGWPGAAPMRGAPTPLGTGWPQAPREAPPPQSHLAFGPEPDERLNTGRGWSIVMPGPQPAISQSYLTVGAGRTKGRVARLNAAFRQVTRLGFNLVLLAIILAMLAIPTAIGVMRFGLFTQPAANTKPTPTPRPIPTASPGYKTLQDSLFTIAYPIGWKHALRAQTERAGYTLHEDDFAGPSHVSLAVATTQTVPQDQLVPLLDSIAASLTDPYQAANFQVLSPTQGGPRYDGQQWLSNEFTFDVSDGKTSTVLHGMALATNYGVGTYVIVFLAPQSEFGNQQTAYLNPMLASFRFRT